MVNKKSYGYWTFEKCKDEALKYNTKKEFETKSCGAHKACRVNKWLNDVCSHMKTDRLYWTFEKCKDEALKYETKTEFSINNSSAYSISCKNKWLDIVCFHMKEIRKPKNYWSYDNCKNDASKYSNRKEYQTKSSGSYYSAKKNKWLDEICSHMKNENNSKRCIYVYIFEDNSVYVGLTNNTKRRCRDHEKDSNSQVYKKIKENIKFIFIQLTEYINIEESIIKEGEFVEKYKNDGYIILNKAKTGSVGSSSNINTRFWTKEKCLIESLKCKSRYEFKLKFNGAYSASHRYKWLDDICSHMLKSV